MRGTNTGPTVLDGLAAQGVSTKKKMSVSHRANTYYEIENSPR